MKGLMQGLEILNEKVSFAFYRCYTLTAERRGLMAVLLGIVAVLSLAGNALAWTTPTTGSFLYDAYDIAVNKLLKGAPGFLLGMGLVGYGGHALLEGQKGRGALALIIGGCLVKLDSITQSLGFYV